MGIFSDKGLLFSSCLANWVGGVAHFIIEVSGSLLNKGLLFLQCLANWVGGGAHFVIEG